MMAIRIIHGVEATDGEAVGYNARGESHPDERHAARCLGRLFFCDRAGFAEVAR